MTTYFDEASEALGQIQALTDKDYTKHDKLREWERKIVRDCFIAGALAPDESLREAVTDVVLKFGIETLPVGCESEDLETLNEFFEKMGRLQWNLHTVFHEFAKANPNIGDGPLTPLRILYSGVEELLDIKAYKAGMIQGPQKAFLEDVYGDELKTEPVRGQRSLATTYDDPSGLK